MGFQVLGQVHQFAVNFRHDILEAGDRFGRAHTGDHILALGVGQKLAVDLRLARGWIAGEKHAGPAAGAQISEDHGHDGYGGAHVVVDLVEVAVKDGPWRVPASEHGLHGGHQLLPRVGGRLGPSGVSCYLLEVGHHGFQLCGGQLVVKSYARLFLVRRQCRFKRLRVHIHDHFGVDLDESAVGIVGRARVAHHGGETFDYLVVDAEIQNSVHHAWHGDTCSRAHGHQEGTRS